jgi:hypothetical protein
VVERVGDDDILGADERLEQAAIRVEAGAVEDRFFSAEEGAETFLSCVWISWVPQMNRTDASPKPQRSSASCAAASTVGWSARPR